MNRDNQDNQEHTPANDCEQLQDLLPAYSMNMTDSDETQLVERLMATCPDVAEEWSDYQYIAEAMLFSAPQHAAPPNIANRLLEATAQDQAPVQVESPKSFLDTLKGLLFPESQSAPRQRLVIAWGAVTVLLLVVSAIIVMFNTQNNSLSEQEVALIAEFPDSEAFLTAFDAPEIFRFDLTNRAQLDANGTLLCNPAYTEAYVQVTDFAQLPDDQIYQIWLVDGNDRISVGTFNVDDNGNASQTFTAPMPMSEYQYIRITTEPADGSSNVPTTGSVVISRLY